MGRPTKYKPEYCEDIIKYFNVEPYTENEITVTKKNGETYTKKIATPNDLPLICGFAQSIDVCTDTINEWTKIHPEFSDALKKAKDIQQKILVTNGMNGSYNSAFAIFTAKNIMGWRDKQDIAHTGELTPTTWAELAKMANQKGE